MCVKVQRMLEMYTQQTAQKKLRKSPRARKGYGLCNDPILGVLPYSGAKDRDAGRTRPDVGEKHPDDLETGAKRTFVATTALDALLAAKRVDQWSNLDTGYRQGPKQVIDVQYLALLENLRQTVNLTSRCLTLAKYPCAKITFIIDSPRTPWLLERFGYGARERRLANAISRARTCTKTLRKLAELLPPEEQTKPQIIVLAGSVIPYRNDTDRELSFRQESNFFYLTGCSVPSSLLLLTASSVRCDDPITTLFIPEAEPADLMWSVPPLTLDVTRETYDVTDVQYASSPRGRAPNCQSKPRGVCVHTPGTSHDSPFVHTLPKTARFPALPSFPPAMCQSSAYLLPVLHRARLTKVRDGDRTHATCERDPLACARGRHARAWRRRRPSRARRPPRRWRRYRANGSSRREAILGRASGVLAGRGGVHARITAMIARLRAAPLRHATVPDLHAGCRSCCRRCSSSITGCEWDNDASDITRTLPVGNGGGFTSEAHAIYELLFEMQTASFKVIRLSLHWGAVRLPCHRMLVRSFKRLGIFRACVDEATLLAAGTCLTHQAQANPEHNPTTAQGGGSGSSAEPGHEKFYEYLRLRLPLEEGMVVTVEPGIYFHHHLLAAIRNSEFIDREVLFRYEPVDGARNMGRHAVYLTSELYRRRWHRRRRGYRGFVVVGTQATEVTLDSRAQPAAVFTDSVKRVAIQKYIYRGLRSSHVYMPPPPPPPLLAHFMTGAAARAKKNPTRSRGHLLPGGGVWGVITALGV
ncbi:hypothetical protein H4582DRAFT_2131793 [Lactarius indigo]|nr:hypothetical protein H4582DRAFT_2131793 [Lactarius indigo]